MRGLSISLFALSALFAVINAAATNSNADCLRHVEAYKMRLRHFDRELSEVTRAAPFILTDGDPEQWRQLVALRVFLGRLLGVNENPEWVKEQAAALNAMKIFKRDGRNVAGFEEDYDPSLMDTLFSALFGGSESHFDEPKMKKNVVKTPLSFARL